MSKKIVSVILSLCIIVCALPMNILAAPEQNETLTFNGGKTLLLQNDYISFYFYDLQYQTCTATVPRAIAKETGEVFTQDIQAMLSFLYTIFTREYEEIGLLGVAELETSYLKGKRLINIDSEDEGIFTAGCAGAMIYTANIPIEFENSDNNTLRIEISGLNGGLQSSEI